MASDGQVTLGQTVVKHQARKVRRLYHDKVLAGFAGAAADGFALFSRFESKLEEHRGNLDRAAVELARDWRTDRALRRLEAMDLIRQISDIFGHFDFPTEILVASVRSPMHIVQAARMGADICTCPVAVIEQCFKHPLTDIGLEKFLKDWEKAQAAKV